MAYYFKYKEKGIRVWMTCIMTSKVAMHVCIFGHKKSSSCSEIN